MAGDAMKREAKNILAALIQHAAAVLSGLILPREILAHYGSEMNGLVQSVTQFLSYTAVLELGLGAVIPAALYRPLVERDYGKINEILASGRKSFRRIAAASILYILILLLLFPRPSADPNGKTTALLILLAGAGTIFYYSVGLPERLLLISDQRGWVVWLMAAAVTVASTAFQVIGIRAGAALTAVRAVAAAGGILLILGIRHYAVCHYPLNLPPSDTGEPIPQKWNGIAQHLAYFVLENTDILLLTAFAGFREVSVYTVYFMVITGVRRIFITVTYSVQPKLGELWAGGQREPLLRTFSAFERRIHLAAAGAFSFLGVTLVPFVQAYTDGIGDANYTRPLFALLLVLAYGVQSLRDPYDKMILAAGHFRQTQGNYLLAAALNLGISLLAVQRFGAEGVAAGTLAAMLLQTIYMTHYNNRILLKRSAWPLIRLFAADALVVIAVTAAAVWARPLLAEIFRIILGVLR